jgi:hypothetical protein
MSRITREDDENHMDGIVLVSRKAEKFLNPRQIESYREHRRKLAEWLLNLGKDPSKAEGYAHSTSQVRMWRLDKFYRWVWNNRTDGYTEAITAAHADAWNTWPNRNSPASTKRTARKPARPCSNGSGGRTTATRSGNR